MTVRESLVELHQVEMPPSTKPPRFLPAFLRVDARNVELTNVRYVHMNGMVVDAKTIRGRVTITSSRLRARDFSVDADLFDATGNVLLLSRGHGGSAHGIGRRCRAVSCICRMSTWI